MVIRDEQPADRDAIRSVVEEAFRHHPHSDRREHLIVDALRDDGALTLSLVADEDDGEIVGEIVFSPVAVGGVHQGWYGLGPVAVRPGRQGAGIGGTLVRSGLERLRALNAAGCVLVGEPAYYERFGFRVHPHMRFEGVPAEYFLALPFGRSVPTGVVTYHAAFATA